MHGQIYIPEVNWILMVLCIIVTVGFRDTAMIGNAYGKCFFAIYWNDFFSKFDSVMVHTEFRQLKTRLNWEVEWVELIQKS